MSGGANGVRAWLTGNEKGPGKPQPLLIAICRF